MPRARELGATHVHVYFLANKAERLSTETDLRKFHRTPLNEQSTPTRTVNSGGLASLGLGLSEFKGLAEAILKAPPTFGPLAEFYGGLASKGLGLTAARDLGADTSSLSEALDLLNDLLRVYGSSPQR